MDLNKGAAAPPIDPMDAEQNKVMAILAYIIFFIPLLAAKESRFAMYHANQGTILFLAGLALSLICGFLAVITLGILFFLPMLASIVWLVFAVLGIINAAQGVAKPLPFIGNYSLFQIP